MRFKKLRKTSYKDSESYDNIMIKREYLNGFIEYDNRKEERCMRKMRTKSGIRRPRPNADVISGFTLLRTVIVCGGILCEGRGKGSF